MEMVSRYFEAPGHSYYLFGPRGTGKTTWLRSEYPQAILIDLLQPDQFRTLKARPERLRERIDAAEKSGRCIIDEIQKAPELLDLVHSLIEEDSGRVFILTGSSARKLRREGVDLMAGRAVYRSLHPFMAGELGEIFDLEKALEIGMIPLVWDSDDPDDTLSAYVDLYLREEIKAEGLVRDLGDFSRFLEAVSFSHAQTLNISNVARECEVPRKRVEGYIGVLEDMLLCYKLPVFRKRAKRELVKQSKFYIFDSGVFRCLRPTGPLDRPEGIGGAALEGLIGQHLRAWIAYRNRGEKLYFWQTRGGSEVDFVVYGKDGIWAIEVKNASNVHRKDLRHLRTFLRDYPQSTAIFLYRGKEKLLIDNITCMPCEKFLRDLIPSSGI